MKSWTDQLIERLTVNQKIMAGAAVLAIIGLFAPWAKVLAPFFGSITISGVDADRGQLGLILIAGAIVALLLRVFRNSGAWYLPTIGAGFGITGLLAFWFLVDVWRSQLGDFALMSAAWGVYLVVLVCAVGVGAAVREWRHKPVESPTTATWHESVEIRQLTSNPTFVQSALRSRTVDGVERVGRSS